MTSIRTQSAASIAKESKKPQTLSEEALRKRKEREEKRAAAARAKALVDGDTLHDELPTPSIPAPAVEPRPATPAMPTDLLESLYTVTIPASSPESLSWYSPQEVTHHTLQTAKEAGVWTYPNNLYERAKCGVFKDLWEKGYYMGLGIKFGGDFLVYPGMNLSNNDNPIFRSQCAIR